MWYYANPNKLNLPSGFPSTSNSSKYSKTLCPGFTWINQWHCWVMFSCALLAYFSGKFGLCKIPSSSPVMFLPQPNNKKMCVYQMFVNESLLITLNLIHIKDIVRYHRKRTFFFTWLCWKKCVFPQKSRINVFWICV